MTQVGAQGFEPRLADIFWAPHTFMCVDVRCETRVGIPVGHQLSANTCRHSRATGARSTTRLYYTPVETYQRIKPWTGAVHAFDDVASSYATSIVAGHFFSKHVNLASW